MRGRSTGFGRTARRRVRSIAAAALVVVLVAPGMPALSAPVTTWRPSAPEPVETLPGALERLDGGGPAVRVGVTPGEPDGYFGWRVAETKVTLRPERAGIVFYRWGTGRWRLHVGRLTAPQGRQRLAAVAVDVFGRLGPVRTLDLKVDRRSPRRVVRSAEESPAPPPNLVSISLEVNPFAGPRVIRLAGADRYGTAAEVSKNAFSHASVVVIARGDQFADALAAAGLAGVLDAPIMLVRSTSVPSVVADDIRRLAASRAVIVGGTGAVSSAVEGTLRGAGLSVERLGGRDRYETAALVAGYLQTAGGDVTRAFVARGDVFADSLSVSPGAFAARCPILLVRPGSLPAATKDAIMDLGIRRLVVCGGEGAVSQEVVGSLATISGVTGIERVGGSDRYETAALASEYLVGERLGDWRAVGLATGSHFPDALCGGANLGKHGGVMLLTPPRALSPQARAKLAGHGDALREVKILGGTGAVSEDVRDQVVDAIR